jgi:hypothetical protein
VNEAVNDFASVRVSTEQAVPMEQCFAERLKFLPQAVFRVVIMVEMNFDIAKAGFAKVTQLVEVGGNEVFVLRIEERMLRRASAAVFEVTEEFQLFGAPAVHAGVSDVPGGSRVVRFEVIAHGDEDVERLVVYESFPGCPVPRDLCDDLVIVGRCGQSFSANLRLIQARAAVHAEKVARQPAVQMLLPDDVSHDGGFDNKYGGGQAGKNLERHD